MTHLWSFNNSYLLFSLVHLSVGSLDGGIKRGSFLSSSIPTELCSLTNLKLFDVTYNELTGTIPDCIGNLTNLHTFVVNENNLEGTIPISFNNLSNLETLDLANNTFEGSFPEQWLGSSPYISLVGLYDNQFTGTLPEVYLPELVGFCSSGNFLNGALPTWAASTKLQELYLFSNAFTGTIPSSYASFPDLCKYTLNASTSEGF